MSKPQNDHLLKAETNCGSLLYELKIIWDEVGESETEKDRMLYEIEQDCLEVYRRKVDQANWSRAQLRQEIADSEADLAAICSAMGERPIHIRQSDQNSRSLKEELARVRPELEEMWRRKSERVNQFIEVQEKIRRITYEIYGPGEDVSAIVDESDLSLRKLEELHRQLLALQEEKSDCLKKVQDHLYTFNSLCSVLGLDFRQIVIGVHPSLGNAEGCKSVSYDTIKQLAVAIEEVRKVKLQRMQKLQDLATTMLELWNLMDTPIEEQQMFQNVTCNIAAEEHEVTEPNSLSMDFINCVEEEVSRLEDLKSSKMKELVLKKRAELEEISQKTHLALQVDSAVEYAVEAIESGSVDPASVLEQLELQVAQVKEEAFSRKEILEKVEKWLSACEDESWLEEYNRDENRYNAGRGTHLTLRRAEKARILINKIPAMVDGLTSKTLTWEKDRGIGFTYDGTHLLSMLEDYTILRQEKEQERRRQREVKKLQGQLTVEQEAKYGSKPSPSKPLSARKAPKLSTGSAANRRVSVGGATIQTLKPDSYATPSSCSTKKTNKVRQIEQQDYLDDDEASYLSSARRGLDIAGAGSVCGIDSPSTRQPFSPISLSSKVSSKSNVANGIDDLNIHNTEKLQKTIALNKLPFTTPPKTATVVDIENPIPVATTPLMVSFPMNLTMTPAPKSVSFGGNLVLETEYSFEERRLGFVLG
ncbi:putative microtubule-associated protein, MAP65/Ase1/PRC1 [Lupinus albus]|uniref:Putative microtubule-associated protein, MAP65/Ase1/PRC1 n=1 Tax=Lupinus albus TaxID=3870 RepID=A0A6A4NU98_LUPAL|nr:putative microtubule-associated protein, MAP65/Ase1/PRC1 [Lupinus albus]